MADWSYYLTSEYKDHRELKLEDGELIIKDDYSKCFTDEEIDKEVFIYNKNNNKIKSKKKDEFLTITIKRLIDIITSPNKTPLPFLQEEVIEYNKPSEILEELKTDKIVINTFKNGGIYDWFLSFVEKHKECDVIKLDSYRWGECISEKNELDVLEYFLNK